MPPHNPMTEGEALAVAQEAYDAARIGGNHEHDALKFAVRALTAHTAASGGEVVAWRKRATSVSTGEFFGETPWYDGLPNAADLAQVENANSRGVAHCWIEYAYRTPPAAVPADALERLVEKWRLLAREQDEIVEKSILSEGEENWHQAISQQADESADELAALIPKGADHG